MNSRDKFLSVMGMTEGLYGKNIEIPKVEFGFWAGTIRRWGKEGLPLKNSIPKEISGTMPMMANKSIYGRLEKSTEENVRSYFGLDYYFSKFPADYSPMFEPTVIEKNEQYRIYKDQFGVTLKINNDISSHPLEIDNPVKDWDSWMDVSQFLYLVLELNLK